MDRAELGAGAVVGDGICGDAGSDQPFDYEKEKKELIQERAVLFIGWLLLAGVTIGNFVQSEKWERDIGYAHYRVDKMSRALVIVESELRAHTDWSVAYHGQQVRDDVLAMVAGNK